MSGTPSFSTATTSSTAAVISPTGSTFSNTAGVGYIHNIGNASLPKLMDGNFSILTSGGVVLVFNASSWTSATAATGLQFNCSSGTMTGVIKLYGIV